MDKKVALIFGINGMDARTLTHLLLSKGYKVIGTYRRNTINLDYEVRRHFAPDADLTLEYCEITDYNSVRDLVCKYAHNISEVYSLAAQSHVGFSFKSPDYSIQVNGQGILNILDNVYKEIYLVCNKNVRHYFAATSELLGGNNPTVPYTEDSPFDCRSPYSQGKAVGVNWTKYYRQLGLFACYGILFNHSNIYRSPDFFIRKVTQAAARISLGKQKELHLGNLNFWRDEHWSDFGCEMMWKMLQNDSPQDYIIANGTTHHGEEFLTCAFNYFGLKWQDYVKLDTSLLRPNEVVKLVGDSTKAQKGLGWRPNRMPFAQHIEYMCKYDYQLESGIELPERPKVFELFP